MDIKDIVINKLSDEQALYFLIYLRSLLEETSEQHSSDPE